MEMTRNFGCTKEGNQASLYVIRNENGMEAAVTDLGATLVSLKVKNTLPFFVSCPFGETGPSLISFMPCVSFAIGRMKRRSGRLIPCSLSVVLSLGDLVSGVFINWGSFWCPCSYIILIMERRAVRSPYISGSFMYSIPCTCSCWDF